MKYFAIGLVYVYRYTIGVLFPGSCKYHPSCSQYAIDALRAHGLVRGTVLTAWRLLRCNPWSHGGVDRVPEPRVKTRSRLAFAKPSAPSSGPGSGGREAL
ncbi:MAG: membrane protein insertion efficiency factor YidD [Actinomycetota bacterium]|nr:membrane protein insertion efficiency factor YidD [Actinomycetota bacterium]